MQEYTTYTRVHTWTCLCTCGNVHTYAPCTQVCTTPLPHTCLQTRTWRAPGCCSDLGSERSNQVVFSPGHIPTLKKTGRDLGPGQEEEVACAQGAGSSRVDPGRLVWVGLRSRQTDRRLQSGEVERPPGRLDLAAGPHRRPLPLPGEQPRRGSARPSHQGGRGELAWDPSPSDVTLPQPQSCGPLAVGKARPLLRMPGALVGLLLWPRGSSSAGRACGTWPGLWQSRGALSTHCRTHTKEPSAQPADTPSSPGLGVSDGRDSVGSLPPSLAQGWVQEMLVNAPPMRHWRHREGSRLAQGHTARPV